VLTDDELRALWKICKEQLRFPMGPCIMLMILLGQRESEVGGLPINELHHLDDPNEAKWWLPFGRYKSRNNREDKSDYLIGVIEPARRIINSIIAIRGIYDGVHLFSGTSILNKSERELVSSWDTTKERVDQLMEKELGRPIPRWTWHDLRRTLRTRIQIEELAVPENVGWMIINHRSETVYDQHKFGNGMRGGLNIWWQYLLNIVTSPYGTVAEIPDTDYQRELKRMRDARKEAHRPKLVGENFDRLYGLPNPDPLVPENWEWPDLNAIFCKNPDCLRKGEPYLPEESTSLMPLMYCCEECKQLDLRRRRSKNATLTVCANPRCTRGGEPFMPERPGAKYCNTACYHDHYYQTVTKPTLAVVPKQVLPPKICPQCKRTFNPKTVRANLCSRECIEEAYHERRRRRTAAAE
jgi:hypothetical protein